LISTPFIVKAIPKVQVYLQNARIESQQRKQEEGRQKQLLAEQRAKEEAQRKQEEEQRAENAREGEMRKRGNEDFVKYYAGVAKCFQDIQTGIEIGVKCSEFKPLIFNLKTEWKNARDNGVPYGRKYDIERAEKAVEGYVKALRCWENSIESTISRYDYQKLRDNALGEANEQAENFLSSYKSAN
jgi:hypothetical protein